MDLVIRNASLPDGRRQVDLAIAGGRIAAVGERLPVALDRAYPSDEVSVPIRYPANDSRNPRTLAATRATSGPLARCAVVSTDRYSAAAPPALTPALLRVGPLALPRHTDERVATLRALGDRRRHGTPPNSSTPPIVLAVRAPAQREARQGRGGLNGSNP